MADDDDVAEDWEDVDTEELERRMEVRQKQVERKEKKVAKNKSKASKQSESPLEEAGSTPVPLEIKTQLPLRIQDSERTEYVAPIKILKRHGDPKTASSGGHSSPSLLASAAAGSGSGSGSKHKSLAEREADYASARARILGSDYKPGGGGGTGESAGAATIAAVVNPTGGGGGGGGGTSASPRSEAGVKRQPRGPNGTRGFKS